VSGKNSFRRGTVVKPVGGRRSSQPPIEVRRTSEQAAAVDQTFATVASTPITPGATPQPAFDNAVRDVLRDRWSDDAPPVAPANADPPPPFEPPDFHRTIAMLREHPAVLRSLGLIAEFRLKATAVPAGAGRLFVRVRLDVANGAQPPIVSPPPIVPLWTEYGSEFRPVSTENISAGMVTLTDDRLGSGTAPRWETATVDVDGATRRLREAARAIGGAARDAPRRADGGPSTPATLPALRSAGLMLIRRGREDDFAARRREADANAARDSKNPPFFTADHLVLGYRIDVKDLNEKQWRSLQQREASYFLREGRNRTIIGTPKSDEEGHIKAHAAVNDGSGTLRTDEVVARWNGWSVAVRRPRFDDVTGEDRSFRHPDMPFDLGWEFTAKNLPRLRFGRSYHMRARVADICGGGLDLLDQATDRCFTPARAVRRYEPITSPEVALPDGAATPEPFDSAELIVIRSDFNLDARSFALHHPEYSAVLRRDVRPSRTSLAMAEQHGALDRLSAEDSWDLVKTALKHGGREQMTTPGTVLLPDFAAAGVFALLRREPDTPTATLTERSWTGDWPVFKDKHLELQERQNASDPVAQWQPSADGGHDLIVQLDKAEQLTIELSSLPNSQLLHHFEIASIPNVSIDAVNQGRHPLLTPARAVTFVHAVRRPLNEPAGELSPLRQPGQTFAELSPDPDFLNIDPKSTAQVDIHGTWTEIMDTVGLTADQPVQSIRVTRGDESFVDALRHHFGDTRHRRITYTVTAVSRFRKFFKDRDAAGLFLASTTLPGPVRIPSSARPAPPIVLATRPAFLWDTIADANRQTITRHRGGILRVQLERPWFQTGEGEKLAVIVSAGGVPPDTLKPFVTQIGRDPTRETADVGRWPTQANVVGRSGDVANPLLAEAGQTVVAIPFDPFFDTDRWFVDVAMPTIANATYCPFGELALARYQPDSLHDNVIDLRLSTVVRSEMVQLFPDRTLTVQQSGDTLTVKLQGLGPGGPRPNRVEVIIEQLRAPAGISADAIELIAFGAQDDDPPAWIALAGSIDRGDLGSDIVVQLPTSDSAPARLRVREVELMIESSDTPAPETGTGAELTERVVFTDTIALPAGDFRA